jgi:hypothetical protein
MGRKRGTSAAHRIAPTQREVLRDVMLAATKCQAWLTLRELAGLTRYGEASISAQLRHLRKARHGGFEVKKRLRCADKGSGGEQFLVWEYWLSGATRKRTLRRRRARRVSA